MWPQGCGSLDSLRAPVVLCVSVKGTDAIVVAFAMSSLPGAATAEPMLSITIAAAADAVIFLFIGCPPSSG